MDHTIPNKRRPKAGLSSGYFDNVELGHPLRRVGHSTANF